MAKLIYLMNASLDAYVADAQGSFSWIVPTEEWISYINALCSSCGTFLYGRRMYEAMVYWETDYAAHNHQAFHLDFARQWQAAEKIVYSRTLAEPRSARTRIEREFDTDAVRRLKADAGRDITIQGPELAAQALRAGLVDEVHLLILPVIVGGGKRCFPGDLRLGLELVEERAFRNGVVAMRYAVHS
ncbi:dihydrofolate reductase family protein [Phototrophicus methaneseepsis]|uniref:Dihydrofolate reductase family protein n=1 Tax=Phototrophicus methaneseepsis TaxID=2710758 RepID=A0A7S8E9L6_9CHLR|nr:dihydrofolate reductase family protein [Phototrophicus methaneseepsis]QPC82774.1 dihydrofolate reductase family protein [Phototrophicus methaneseepsis]